LYAVVSKAWKSKSFRPSISFTEVGEKGPDGRSMSITDVVERKASTGHVDQSYNGGRAM